MTFEQILKINEAAKASVQLYKENLENLSPEVEKDFLIERMNQVFYIFPDRGTGVLAHHVEKMIGILRAEYDLSEDVYQRIIPAVKKKGFYDFFRNQGITKKWEGGEKFYPNYKIAQKYFWRLDETDGEFADPEILAALKIIERIKIIENSNDFESIGKKVYEGGRKGGAATRALCEKERRKTECYRLFDKHMNEPHQLPQTEIKKLIAGELRVSTKTVTRYLKERGQKGQ